MYEIHQIEDTPLLTLPRENPRCDLGITVFLHSWNQISCSENFLIALVLQLTTGLSRGCNNVFAPRKIVLAMVANNSLDVGKR